MPLAKPEQRLAHTAGDGKLREDSREGLLHGLRSVFNEARLTGRVARQSGIRVRQNGGWHAVSIEVTPLTAAEQAEPWVAARLIAPRQPVYEVLEASTMLRPVDVGQARRTSGVASARSSSAKSEARATPRLAASLSSTLGISARNVSGYSTLNG